MNKTDKNSTSGRRTWIVDTLKNSKKPITGGHLAQLANVSRQVIVQDVSILRAKGEPIIATSQGYTYVSQQQKDTLVHKVIAVSHGPEHVRDELYIIVDHGVTIKNVIVEHAVYGELTASIMVSNRMEADQFINKIKMTNASYLSTLTDGVHLHMLTADKPDKITAACKALKKAGILLE